MGIAGSIVLVLAILVSEPLGPDESVLPYYAVSLVASLLIVGLYEGATFVTVSLLSRIFGFAPDRTEPAEGRSIRTIGNSLALVVLYYGGILLVGIVAGLAIVLLVPETEGGQDLTASQLAWIVPLGMLSGMLGCAVFTRRQATRRDLVTFRRWVRPPGRQAGFWTVAGGIAGAFIAAFVLPQFVPISEGYEPGTIGRLAAAEGWPRVAFASVAILLAPPIEEFIFRGVFLDGVRKVVNTTWAVAASALFFALFHVPDTWGHWPGLLAVFLGGVVLAVLRLRTRSLLLPIIGHASYNATLVVLMMAWPQ